LIDFLSGDAEDAAPVTPEVGEVREGYAFLGGSPVDPNNWQELQ